MSASAASGGSSSVVAVSYDVSSTVSPVPRSVHLSRVIPRRPEQRDDLIVLLIVYGAGTVALLTWLEGEWICPVLVAEPVDKDCTRTKRLTGRRDRRLNEP